MNISAQGERDTASGRHHPNLFEPVCAAHGYHQFRSPFQFFIFSAFGPHIDSPNLRAAQPIVGLTPLLYCRVRHPGQWRSNITERLWIFHSAEIRFDANVMDFP